jgi:hypothetical protein
MCLCVGAFMGYAGLFSAGNQLYARGETIMRPPGFHVSLSAIGSLSKVLERQRDRERERQPW